jgi:hypothetical protein
MSRDLGAVAPRLDPLIRRLASDHEGEVLATVAAIKRVLSSDGRDLHDLADAIARPSPTSSPSTPSSPAWRRQVQHLLQHCNLKPRDECFLRSLLRFKWLSEKQLAVLGRIWNAHVRGAA